MEITGAVWLLGELIAVVSSLDGNFFSAAAVIVMAIGSGLAALVWLCTKPFWTRKLNDGTHIKIRMGDITKQRGCAVLVGTNDELNCEDEAINCGSIQYQLQTNQALGDKIKQTFQAEREKHPTANYGTIIPVTEDSDRQGRKKAMSDRAFHFLVMSKLKPNQNAETKLSELDQAISDYFQKIGQLYVPNKKLEVPLIGTGTAGVYSETNAKIDIAVRLVRHLIRGRGQHQCQNVREMVIRIPWMDFRYINWQQLDTLIEQTLQICQECDC